MTASPTWGGRLTETDYTRLLRSWITSEVADRALLRRVTTSDGASIIGRRDNGSYAGIIFPYVWPGENHCREYWLRRDQPEIQYDEDGHPKEKNKYLGPPGRGNLLYIAPGTPASLLNDVSVPVAVTEGAKKAIALSRLSSQGLRETTLPRFLAIGLSGVWSGRGVIGKVEGPDGSRRDEKGPISDLARIAWVGRRVFVVYDSNVQTNPKVAAARSALTTELCRRGAEVLWVNLPSVHEGTAVNGVDDLLGAAGPDRVLKLFDEARTPSTGKRDSQSQILASVADEVELLHTPQGEGYARVGVGQHYETWILRSKGFRQWLTRRFYQISGKPPGVQALQDAIALLEARARFEGAELPLSVRVAGVGDRIYIDLCNAEWQAVEISAEGWRVVSDTPISFRRTKGLLPLPLPELGGSLASLRRYINIGSECNSILCTAWLVAACRPQGTYPILILQGEQGSAKSTTERILRRIVDPSTAPIRTPPRDERDLLIAASNSWVIAYDNLSGIPPWLSDSLCRLATGGGFSTRELYSDSEETFFDAMRPVMLNGIDQLAERADLADRALILNLPRIADTDRRDEEQLYNDFEGDLPCILGGLFSAISEALARVRQVKLPKKPRMADFAIWASAAELALGFPDGAFMKTYTGNRAEAVHETLENDQVASAIFSWVETFDESETRWNGTCTDMKMHLERFVDDGVKKSRGWPQTPRALSSRLRRLSTFLREAGIDVAFEPRGTKGQRTVTIEKNSRTFDRH